MHYLRNEGNDYHNDYRRNFDNRFIPVSLLNEVMEFAYEMCFGEGHHRHHRTGGQLKRKAGELFCNTFQGKLAEVVLRDFLLKNGLPCEEPDFGIYGEGKWDDKDLVVNDKTLSVKSAAFFSNLLLLETHDYDNEGNYLPNLNNGTTAQFDYYVLVRIKPDIKKLFREKRLLYTDKISKEQISVIIDTQTWTYDIAGWISHEEFVNLINNKFIIPQNAKLNGRIPMDAENYYVQSGDMHPIGELCNRLKN